MVESMRADCLIVDSRPQDQLSYPHLGTFSPILESPYSLASSPYSQPAASSSPGLQKASQK